MSSIEMIIENLLKKHLEPIKANQELILKELKELREGNTIEQPKAQVMTKKAIEKKITYGPNVQAFFDDNKVEYNTDKSVESNLDTLCEQTDKAINIQGYGNTLYSHKTQRKFPVNCKMDTKKIAVCNNTQMNILKCEVKDNIKSVEKATKKNFKDTCELLNIQSDLLCPFKIASNIIKKSFQGIALEKLTEEETHVNNCARGSVNYLSQKGIFIEKGFSYDINSFHPFILGKSDFTFPVRQGKHTILSEIDETVPGIYAIAIKDPIKYFIQAEEKEHKVWHSHYTIQMLKAEGIKYKLLEVESEGYNAILYNKEDCVKSSDLFGETVKTLYSERKNPVCKFVNQTLFGCMTKQDHTTKTVAKEDITADIFEDTNIKTLSKRKSTSKSFILADDATYALDTARMKLFFYDYCRLYLFNTYLKKYDPIRISTDSILLPKTIDKKLLTNELGGLKRELKLVNITYPKVNHSFKNNPIEGVYGWDNEEEEYVELF